MPVFSSPFRALVIGSSGSIGAAFVSALKANPACTAVVGINRHSQPPINYNAPDSIEQAAQALAKQAPFQLIINTTGILHSADFMPEKKLDDLNITQMSALLNTNTIGPALTLKHFSKLLDVNGSVLATLSAKVGSIEDNRLGGWYSYRASKAALNMIIKTASIEFKRTKPHAALIALHPGTVKSALSKPFKGEIIGRPPADAAQDMLKVLQDVKIEDTGSFLSYSGEKLPW